jgi:membrane-bound ClpP family serine protease
MDQAIIPEALAQRLNEKPQPLTRGVVRALILTAPVAAVMLTISIVLFVAGVLSQACALFGVLIPCAIFLALTGTPQNRNETVTPKRDIYSV